MDPIHSLFASPSYLVQVDEPEHPRELHHLRFVGLVEDGCTVTMWRLGAVGKFPIAQQPQLPTHDETLVAVLAGQGIGTLPPEFDTNPAKSLICIGRVQNAPLQKG